MTQVNQTVPTYVDALGADYARRIGSPTALLGVGVNHPVPGDKGSPQRSFHGWMATVQDFALIPSWAGGAGRPVARPTMTLGRSTSTQVANAQLGTISSRLAARLYGA